MTVNESFEDWWFKRGMHWFPSTAKVGLKLVFTDAWHRALKVIK